MDRDESLRGAVALSHYFLKERVSPGDNVLDATCGNGFDTLLLAQLVGESGHVLAFDIQEKALENSSRLLEERGCRGQVELILAGHERLSEFVEVPLSAAIFNLGYLPGGDKNCITLPDTTVSALTQASRLLQAGGLLLVVVYTGHAGGPEEEQALLEWARALLPDQFNVWLTRQLTRSSSAPYLVVVEKRRMPGSL